MGFGRQQIGCHAEQLIRIAIRPLGNASAGADIPIAVGVAVHCQYSFPLLAHESDFPYSSARLCRRNPRKFVSAPKGGYSTVHSEPLGLKVDIEGSGSYPLHPARRLRGAAEGKEMRSDD